MVAPAVEQGYATLLRQYVEEIARYRISVGEVEPRVIIHDDQYLLVQVGWQGIRRVHGLTLHARLREGKVWIEHDGTPAPGLALWLVEQGVPKDAIVLAFYVPESRQLSGFAVG